MSKATKIPDQSRGSGKRKRVRGVWDHTVGRFLPYPFPLDYLSRADGHYSLEMSVRKDDEAESRESEDAGETPLVVEFRVQFYTDDSPYDFSKYLLKRARHLGIEPEELPEKATLDVTDAEERAIEKALSAIDDALWYASLRWAGLEERNGPPQMRVPATVAVGTNGEPTVVGRVVRDSSLREQALQRLQGDDLHAFVWYARLWRAAHEET